MGYFSNGTEGMAYFDYYCSRCIFDKNEDCPIWTLHIMHNYKECNKPDSFLHMLIPRSKNGGNEECRFFIPQNQELKLEQADD